MKRVWTAACRHEPNEIDRHVGARVRSRRRALTLSRQDLARASLVSLSRVVEFEAGVRRLRPAEFVAIAEALDAPLLYFFDAFAANGSGIDGSTPFDERVINGERLPTDIAIASSNGFRDLPIMVMKDRRLVETQIAAAGLPDLKVLYDFLPCGALGAQKLRLGQVQFAAVGATAFLALWDRTRDTLRAKALRAMGSAPFYLCSGNHRVQTIADFTAVDRINVHRRRAMTLNAIALEMAAAANFGAAQFNRLDRLMVGLPAPKGVDALISGGVTADFSSPPFSYQELGTPGVHLITTLDDVLGGPAANNIFATSDAFADRFPAITAAVGRAFDQAIEAVQDDRRGAGEVHRRVADKRWAIHVDRMVEDSTIRFDRNPDGILRYAEFMHRVGHIAQRPDRWEDLFRA